MVTLREIIMDNFRECLNLKLLPEQERFVAPNIYSLAEAKADGVSIPLAIYDDETMVGFTMFNYEEEKSRGNIDRLMVDHRYQGKGYGRAAMLEVIERLKRMPGCNEIQVSFLHDNIGADKLYASLGFTRTGKMTPDGDETIVAMKVNQ